MEERVAESSPWQVQGEGIPVLQIEFSGIQEGYHRIGLFGHPAD